MSTYYQFRDGSVIHDSTNLGGWTDAVKLTKAEGERLIRLQAIKGIKKIMGRNRTVYTVLRHVSSSGMQRRISALVVSGKDIVCIDPLVAEALDWRLHDSGGVVVGGAGMDMGFHLVYTLSRVLFKDDPKNRDPGYTLTQRWL